MMNLRSLQNLGALVNSPFLGEWPHKVGAYMLNFGGIEFISFKFLSVLEVSRLDFDRNLTLPLADRIKRILVLVDSSTTIPDPVKLEIKGLWQEVKELSKWRNRIAHNPLLPTWKPGSDAEKDPPDLLGVPDMRQIKGTNNSDSLSIEGLNLLIDATQDIAQRLLSASNQIN